MLGHTGREGEKHLWLSVQNKMGLSSWHRAFMQTLSSSHYAQRLSGIKMLSSEAKSSLPTCDCGLGHAFPCSWHLSFPLIREGKHGEAEFCMGNSCVALGTGRMKLCSGTDLIRERPLEGRQKPENTGNMLSTASPQGLGFVIQRTTILSKCSFTCG